MMTFVLALFQNCRKLTLHLGNGEKLSTTLFQSFTGFTQHEIGIWKVGSFQSFRSFFGRTACANPASCGTTWSHHGLQVRVEFSKQKIL